MSATYLLRFDDICPTMNWTVWRDLESILLGENLKPILAVVPDNQDPVLRAGPARPDFWDKVRQWQAAGWAIGLHGYQHRYVTENTGLLGRNRYSEFAGLPFDEQSRKLRLAIDVFRREAVRPDLWIAPAHSYDERTLDALAALGIDVVSDGYSVFPYVDRRKFLYIPQQFGKFRWAPLGVWTVCMHINGWSPSQLVRFRQDIGKYKDRLSTMQEVIATYSVRQKHLLDNLTAFSFRVARQCGTCFSLSR